MIMKRSVLFLLLGLFLLSFAASVDNVNQNEVPATVDSPTEIDTEGLTGDLRDAANQDAIVGLLDTDNDTAPFTTQLPSFLDKPARMMFNVKETIIINLEMFIVLLAISISIFIIVLEILEFTAFETSWVKTVIASGLTLVSAIIGSTYWVVEKIMTFNIKILGAIGVWPQLTMFLWLIAFMAIAIILKIVSKKIKHKSKVDIARGKGYGLAAAVEGAQTLGDAAINAASK
jgi:hypothetical protein